jgi:hypothetical protein
MNEMDLLTRLRDEVPYRAVSPQVEDLFRAAIEAERTRVPAHRIRPSRPIRPGRWVLRSAWRLTVAIGLAAALAVGLVVGLVVASPRPAGGGPAADATLAVKLLADRAATAALAGPAVRPGQWVYRKTIVGPGTSVRERWATADDLTQAAYIQGTLLTCPRHGRCHPAEIGGVSDGLAWPVTGGISYAALGSLPADPRALVSRLADIRVGCQSGDGPCHAFGLIGQLFVAYLMPPALTAELYRALGDIPGVTVVKNAVDVAGQRGVAFRLPLQAPGPAYEEIIINPRTYQFMGWDSPAHPGPLGQAVIVQELVPGPGIRP